ncbi:MAG: hypothetical protein ACR2Q4_12770 [Geminicoccaceae bacterium]
MAFSWTIRRRRPNRNRVESAGDDALNLADIHLQIEDGLLTTFGPSGDPVPPQSVKHACAEQPADRLRQADGTHVESERVIAVLDAQQRGTLADRQSDPWIEAMLGAAGGFEDTPQEILAQELLTEEAATGQNVSSGTIGLDLPSGEAVILRNAHPGEINTGPLAAIVIDGRPCPIEAFSGALHRDVSVGSITLKEDGIALACPPSGQGWLEAAASVWTGAPKVSLTLADGRQLSVDDLFIMLRSEATESLLCPEESRRRHFPLLTRNYPGMDLEQATIVTVSSLPNGWSLTKGRQNSRGVWFLDPSDLESTEVVARGDLSAPASLDLNVISAADQNGDVGKQTFALLCPAPWSTTLIFDAAEKRTATTADALWLRGMPEEASLSKGSYDPSIRGWILRPDELDGLIATGTARPPDDVEIELLAIRMNGAGQANAEVIARMFLEIHG